MIIKSTCPECRSVISVDSTDSTPNSNMEVECPLCGTLVSVKIPEELPQEEDDMQFTAYESTLPTKESSLSGSIPPPVPSESNQSDEILRLKTELEELKKSISPHQANDTVPEGPSYYLDIENDNDSDNVRNFGFTLIIIAIIIVFLIAI